MSASFKISGPKFPNGTVVKAYPKSNWPTPAIPSGAPVGSSAAEATVSGSSATLFGLTAGTEYWAVAQVSGKYRYLGFTAGEDVANSADQATKAEIELINLGSDWSEGENQKGFSANLLGQRQAILHGSVPAPDQTVGPTVKIVRTSKISKAQIEAAGAVGTDGGDQLAAIMGIHVGVPGNGVQVVGLAGFAKNASDVEDNPDAAGLYGIGRITGGTSLAAGAFGLFAQARRDVATARATGAEIQVANYAGVDGVYLASGSSDTKALWVVPNGSADSAVGMQFQNAFGRQFLYGVAFGNQVSGGKTGPIKLASIVDDSTSETVLHVRGAHVNAIKLEPASGVVDLGKNAILNPPAALGNPYRQVGPPVAGRATAAAVAGTKYFLMPGSSDVTAPAPQTTPAQSQPFLIVVSGADMSGVGTAKMRIKGIVITQNKPEVTLSMALYPVTGGATQSLGEAVTGSSVSVEKPPANSDTAFASADFTPPADGIYTIGYTVSGAPAVALAIQARAEYHHV
jgi:hypothetical protein